MTKSVILAAMIALLSNAPALAEVKTAQQGAIKATLSLTSPPKDQLGSTSWQSMQMQITRQGQVYKVTPPNKFGRAEEFSISETRVDIIDWEGDQDPEILATFYSGGAHCCLFSIVYSFDPQNNQYQAFNYQWGQAGFQPEKLKDLDKDGRLDFVTSDSRFEYVFGSYVSSYDPIKILNFQGGKFVDVTRKFPKLIRAAAADAWKAFQQAKKEKSPYGNDPRELRYQLSEEKRTGQSYKGELLRPPLAAYLACKYLLGEEIDGWKQVKSAYRISDRNNFFRDLSMLLRKSGYAH